MKTNSEIRQETLAFMKGNWGSGVLVTFMFLALVFLCSATATYSGTTLGGLAFGVGVPQVQAFGEVLNILVSIFASNQGVPKVISKVNRGQLASMADNLGLDCIVSPKKTVSDVLARYARAIKSSQASNSIETLYKLMDGGIEAVEFNVGKEFKGIKIPLKDLSIKPNTLIAGIIRGRKSIIPGGMDEILAGDRVVVIVSGQQLTDLDDILR